MVTSANQTERSLSELTHHFGKVGQHYYKIARGQDDRAVEPNRIRKSIGAETSFAEDLHEHALMLLELEQIAQILYERINKHQASGRTLTLKVKFSDYQLLTRSKTLMSPISELDRIAALAKELFEAIDMGERGVRLLGISLSNLDNVKEDNPIQLSLFE